MCVCVCVYDAAVDWAAADKMERREQRALAVPGCVEGGRVRVCTKGRWSGMRQVGGSSRSRGWMPSDGRQWEQVVVGTRLSVAPGLVRPKVRFVGSAATGAGADAGAGAGAGVGLAGGREGGGGDWAGENGRCRSAAAGAARPRRRQRRAREWETTDHEGVERRNNHQGGT